MYLSNFQSYIFGSILLFIMGFVSCEKNNSNPLIIKFGERSILTNKEIAWFGNTKTDAIKVSVKQINDSRCPIGVECIWAGEANVKVMAQNLADSTLLQLKISPTKGSIPDTLNFTLGRHAYQLILFAVDPYPNLKMQVQGVAKVTLTVNNK